MAFNYDYNVSKAKELNNDIWTLDQMKVAIEGKNTELNSSCQGLEIGLISTAILNMEKDISKASSDLTLLITSIMSVAAEIKKQEDAATAAAAAAIAMAAAKN